MSLGQKVIGVRTLIAVIVLAVLVSFVEVYAMNSCSPPNQEFYLIMGAFVTGIVGKGIYSAKQNGKNNERG